MCTYADAIERKGIAKGEDKARKENGEIINKEELFNLRFSHATGQLANPASINVCKKDIARVKTLLRERELNGETSGTGKKA